MRPLFKRFLKRIHCLEPLQNIKRKLLPLHKAFMPCTPHLLIAIEQSLLYLKDKKILDGSDYLEFGIFRGFAFWYTQQLCKMHGAKEMRFFGFDSFLGLPKLEKIDQGGDFSEGAYECPRQDVEAHLNYYGVDWRKTHLIEGWFSETLNQKTHKKYGFNQVSLCVIDCDLYESTRDVLRFVLPMIKGEAIFIFDDWNSYNKADDRGERKAFKEFLAKNIQLSAQPFFEFGGHGQAFLITLR